MRYHQTVSLLLLFFDEKKNGNFWRRAKPTERQHVTLRNSRSATLSGQVFHTHTDTHTHTDATTHTHTHTQEKKPPSGCPDDKWWVNLEDWSPSRSVAIQFSLKYTYTALLLSMQKQPLSTVENTDRRLKIPPGPCRIYVWTTKSLLRQKCLSKEWFMRLSKSRCVVV